MRRNLITIGVGEIAVSDNPLHTLVTYSLKKLFWKNGVMVDKEHVEGNVSRTVRLDIATGEVRLRLGYGEELIL